MKTEDLQDLRSLLSNIEFANLQLQNSTQKIEKLSTVHVKIENLEPFTQGLDNAISALKIKSDELKTVAQDLNELDVIAKNFSFLKNSLENFRIKVVLFSFFSGSIVGGLLTTIYFFLKVSKKL